MARRCLTSARFTMLCDIVKPPAAPESAVNFDESPGATWEYYQDPDSGALVKRWTDNPDTPDIDESRRSFVIEAEPMIARSVMTKGFNGASSMEKFSETYDNIDWVNATFSAKTNITKRDQVVNIRTKSGDLVWREEEMTNSPGTTFEVMGITPVLDPFNKVIEKTVLLKRSEVQRGS